MVLRITIEMASFFRFTPLKMQKEWRIAPEKRWFCIEKMAIYFEFEVSVSVSTNDEFCVAKRGTLFKNEEFCIKHDEFCSDAHELV